MAFCATPWLGIASSTVAVRVTVVATSLACAIVCRRGWRRRGRTRTWLHPAPLGILAAVAWTKAQASIVALCSCADTTVAVVVAVVSTAVACSVVWRGWFGRDWWWSQSTPSRVVTSVARPHAELFACAAMCVADTTVAISIAGVPTPMARRFAKCTRDTQSLPLQGH